MPVIQALLVHKRYTRKGINADKLRKKRDVIVCVLFFCVMLKGKCSFFFRWDLLKITNSIECVD